MDVIRVLEVKIIYRRDWLSGIHINAALISFNDLTKILTVPSPSSSTSISLPSCLHISFMASLSSV